MWVCRFIKYWEPIFEEQMLLASLFSSSLVKTEIPLDIPLCHLSGSNLYVVIVLDTNNVIRYSQFEKKSVKIQ